MGFGPFTAQYHVQITTLGLEFAVAVALGAAAGWWADGHFGLTPWLTVTGALAGFALGMYMVVKEARRAEQEDKKGK